MSQFRRILKTVLFFAVLSICSPNVWAQSEVEPGFAKFRYIHPFDSSRYLSEIEQWAQSCIGVGMSNESTIKTFHLDTISKGRFVVTANYVKTKTYA